MKKERLFELIEHTDEQLIARAEQRKVRHPALLRRGIIAACLALLLCTAILLPLLMVPDPTLPPDTTSEDTTSADFSTQDSATEDFTTDSGPGAPYVPTPVGVATAPDALGGDGLVFISGSSTSIEGGQAEPPLFEFQSTSLVVKAKVVQSLPDTYYKLDNPSTRKPTAYRLIQMQTLKVLHGENLPETFLYLLPEYLFVDMSVYDCLYISMTQIGIEQYILRNGTQNTVQAFDLPVFADYQGLPQLGNIIAFSDGVFDESLWQNESWFYGYQFARFSLDNPSSHAPLVVYRGYTEQQTEDAIASEIEAWREWRGDAYSAPSPLLPDRFSQEIKEVLAYVAPFENGVFSQTIQNGNTLIFRRYINGVQTEETVRIDPDTQEITYSDVRYTQEDYEKMENLAPHVSALAAAYAQQSPTPPRVDPTGKKLYSLSVFGWYVKTENGIYGIIKTVWIYTSREEYTFAYYDDDYTVYDAQNATVYKNLTPEEVKDITGDSRNVYHGDYQKQEVPT